MSHRQTTEMLKNPTRPKSRRVGRRRSMKARVNCVTISTQKNTP